jgi:hypothetical protein
MVFTFLQQENHVQDAQKGCPARPQPMATPQAYPLGYVEDVAEVRTLLADFFSILLDRKTVPWKKP